MVACVISNNPRHSNPNSRLSSATSVLRSQRPLCCASSCICKLRVLNSLQPLLSLFATLKKVNSFGINQIQPLFPKHPVGCISHPDPVCGFHASPVGH